MEQAQLQLPDHIVVVGYFALMVSIGVYFRRFMERARDYFTGANEVPWWLAGVSFYMTSFSTFLFVAYGEIAYLYGWVAVTLVWLGVPACLVAAYWVAPLWRRARVLTPVEFLETRFNSLMRQLFAWSGFPLRIADNGLRLYALGVFVSVGMGMDIQLAIISCGLVMLAYTFLGGLWAVAVTDFIQFVVLLLALLILFPLAFQQVGSLDSFFSNLPSERFLSLANPPYGWVYILGFGVLILLNYNAGWALVQRFYSVKDEREARKVGLLAAVLYFVGPMLFFIPVMLATQFLPDLENTRHAYVTMTLKLLPVGMMGIVITAMFSATMSSLSSEYNVLASVATTDIYQRLFNPQADEKQLLRMGRIFTGAVGLVIMGIAMIVTYYPDTPLFGIMVTVYGVAAPPMMVPLLGGLIFRGLSARGAIVGFVAGVVTGFTTLGVQTYYLARLEGFDEDWIRFEWSGYSIFINVGVCAAAMALYTLFEKLSGKRRPGEEARIRDFFRRMEQPIEATGEFSDRGRLPSPFFITGLVMVGIGALLVLVSFLEPTSLGRWINVLAGTGLALVGWILYRSRRPTAVE